MWSSLTRTICFSVIEVSYRWNSAVCACLLPRHTGMFYLKKKKNKKKTLNQSAFVSTFDSSSSLLLSASLDTTEAVAARPLTELNWAMLCFIFNEFNLSFLRQRIWYVFSWKKITYSCFKSTKAAHSWSNALLALNGRHNGKQIIIIAVYILGFFFFIGEFTVEIDRKWEAERGEMTCRLDLNQAISQKLTNKWTPLTLPWGFLCPKIIIATVTIKKHKDLTHNSQFDRWKGK